METFIKLKLSVLLLSLIMLCNKAYTQTDTNFWNTGLRLIAKPNSSSSMLYIKDSVQLLPTTFITSYSSQIGLGSLDNLIQYSSKNDGVYTHNRYQQYHNGIIVENGQYIIHCKDGYARYANGIIVKQLNITTTPVITDSIALQNSLNYIGAPLYGWQVYNDDSTTLSTYPIPKLLIIKLDSVVPIYKLAYKLELTSIIDSTINSVTIYIDAMTGTVIKKRNLSQSSTCNCCNGTAQTIYNGQQTITTHERSFPNNDFVLKDECRGGGIESVFIKQKLFGGIKTQQIDDGDNNWSAPEEQASTSSLWALEQVFDYYLNTFNQNSFDNQGSRIVVMADKSGATNAFWDLSLKKMIVFQGVNQISKSLVSLDVLGHEFTHGIIQASSSLDGIGESGALNESFADIMGEMIEFSVTPNASFYEKGSEWLLSTNINDINLFRRSFVEPNIYMDASTYNGNFWVNPTDLNNDNGGVHQNNGVQNKWFYLLAEGGSGVNDKGYNYCVQGIGKTAATRIVFQNMIHNITIFSNFSDARSGAILAAEQLFGANSNEVAQTTAAWYAVGVGNQYSGNLNIQNVTINTPYSVHYNSKIYAQGLTVIGGDLDVSSNTEIELAANVDIYQGSNAAFYIAPACAGGARLANPNINTNNTNETLQEEVSIAQPTARLQKTNELSPLTIYPNPTTGTLNISAPQPISTLIITNLMGQVVTQVHNINNAITIVNTQQLVNGTYLLKTIFNDNSTSVTKFTKE